MEYESAEQHRGDRGDAIGLEQVCGHAGAIADVVADVVRDHGRVARIVFRNACLDFANEVGADVGALGVDAAAEPGEDRDERAAEAQADHRVERRAQIVRIEPVHDGEVAGHRDEPQADDKQTGDGTSAEGHRERRTHALARGFGGAHVGAHRDGHADEAGRAREQRPDEEADGGLP